MRCSTYMLFILMQVSCTSILFDVRPSNVGGDWVQVAVNDEGTILGPSNGTAMEQVAVNYDTGKDNDEGTILSPSYGTAMEQVDVNYDDYDTDNEEGMILGPSNGTAMEQVDVNVTRMAFCKRGSKKIVGHPDGYSCRRILPGPKNCRNCCNPRTFWWGPFKNKCGKEPCWGKGTYCLKGTSCKSCCRGSKWKWRKFRHYCK